VLARIALLVVLVCAPVTAGAQPARIPVVGLLSPGTRDFAADTDEAFRQGLRDLGHVEGRSITLEYRYADGDESRLAMLAAELVKARMDVIVAAASTSALAAKRATSSIPIVFATANDPIGIGLIASLARPGGNATGVSPMNADLIPKRLELLKSAVPGLTRLALLSSSNYPAEPRGALVKEVETVARGLKMDVRVFEFARGEELDGVFAAMAKERVGGVTALPIAAITRERQRVVDLALKHRMASIFHWPEYAEAGGLMSYGTSRREQMRRAAGYVDKILKGAKPSELPVEQATTFDLVVNLRTARALGLTIPPAVLARAARVIQ